MDPERSRRYAVRTRLLGLSRRAARPLDRRIHQFILDLVPAEDGIPIPGVLGFIGCYFRQLVRVRPAVARNPDQLRRIHRNR